MKLSVLITLLLLGLEMSGQLPSHRRTDWSSAGTNDTGRTAPIFHFKDFSQDTSKINPDSCMDVAITHLKSIAGGTLLIGPGNFVFHKSIMVPSHVIIKGAGKSTRIVFDFQNQARDGFIIRGSAQSKKYTIDSIYNNRILIESAPSDPKTKYAWVGFDDSDLLNNAWAYGCLGTFIQIDSIHDNAIEASELIDLDLFKGRQLHLQFIEPAVSCAIQCLYIERLDATTNQSSNIYVDYGIHCVLSGIESNKTNFSHIVLNRSTHCLVERNYIHHAHAYGGGGQGYGITLQMGSEKNLVRDNIFNHLRHSVLLQSGASKNVCSYNHSTDPYVSDNPLTDAGGDLVCHGNFACLNLFEGNVCQNIVIDNSHGRNGPYNTFFRNRAESYGVLVSSGQDSQNFIANEVTGVAALKGQFILNGTGHFRQSNLHKGTNPDGTFVYPNSLYLDKLPVFWNIPYKYWGIGIPKTYLEGSNPAFIRFKDSSDLSPCDSPVKTSGLSYTLKPAFNIYPNPLQRGEILNFSNKIDTLQIYNMLGIRLQTLHKVESMQTEHLLPGVYLLVLNNHEYYRLIVD